MQVKTAILNTSLQLQAASNAVSLVMMSARLQEIRERLKRLENKKRAAFSLHYFKTGPGEYGEGARFLGIAAPDLRKLAREYRDTAARDLQDLLRSAMHEERSLSLLGCFAKSETGMSPPKKPSCENTTGVCLEQCCDTPSRSFPRPDGWNTFTEKCERRYSTTVKISR